MVEIADIRDRESFEAWLEDKPRELAVLLAHRAAARVMPIYWAWAADSSTEGDLTNMFMWQKLPTSRVFAVYAARDVGAAATIRAFYAIRAAAAARTKEADNSFRAAAAIHAANSAATRSHQDDPLTSAYLARAAGRNDEKYAVTVVTADIWEEIRRDAVHYLGTDMRASLPLWQDAMPTGIAEAWTATRAALTERVQAGDTGWQFWIDWYEAQLSGADQTWEMLKKIVLIPDDDWKRGAAHVNGMIEGIRIKHAIPASPNAEILEFNPDTGLIRSRPITDINEGFLEDCRARMRDAAEMFGDPAEGNNPYGALSPEIATLERALERYPDRPQRLHDVALQVVRRVAARERSGDIPEAEKDALVADFKMELIGVADDIRQQDAEVQKVVDARVTDKLRNADPADAAVLPEAAPVLAEATEAELAEELVEDADLAADTEADPQTRKEALYRFASRSFRIALLLYKVPRAVLKEGAQVSRDIATIVTNSAKVKIAIAILLALFG